MQFNTVALLLSVSAVSMAQELEFDDYPVACQSACQDIVNLTNTCDLQNTSDVVELSCICNATNAQAQATACAACAKANGQIDNDSDIADLMRDCNWNYASVAASTAATSAPASASSGAVSSGTTGTTGTTGNGGVVSTNVPATTAVPGAAPMASAGVAGAIAGMVLGAFPAVL